MKLFLSAISLLAIPVHCHIDELEYMKFPEGFTIGISTAAYQIEGAWNVSDKGLNVWDKFTHQVPSPILDGSTGDVACDSYRKYKEDIALLQDLGVDSYRLSLSWSRILPAGYDTKISEDGLRYYKNLLDDLKSVGIEPLVTLYHWDHPNVFEEMGGWTNEMMVTWFADYARVVFRELGSRVKLFATINEPNLICLSAYQTGTKAPGKKLGSLGAYTCGHNMLKAHAKVYDIYHNEFRGNDDGKIGIILACSKNYGKSSSDDETAEVAFQFNCGWFANPIFSSEGDYPSVMKERIAENSRLEGFSRSKLPEFTAAEIKYIKGSADYFGLNHYTSNLVESTPKSENTLWYQDSGVLFSSDPEWLDTGSPWNQLVPEGFGDILRSLKDLYDNPIVLVTENGMADVDYERESRQDHARIKYLHDYIREMLVAINRDGCNVQGYYVWSLLDNFEWQHGYTESFGLVAVDFNNINRPRTPKLSCSWFQTMTRRRELPSINYDWNKV